MYIDLKRTKDIYRALGFLDGVAATVKDETARAAIYDAIEQLENALAEEDN